MLVLLSRPTAIDFFHKTSIKTKEISMLFCPKNPRMPYICVQILDSNILHFKTERVFTKDFCLLVFLSRPPGIVQIIRLQNLQPLERKIRKKQQ